MNQIDNTNNKKSSYFLKCGLFAGIASSTSIISYPFEVLKIRYQVLENRKLTHQLIRNMINEEGVGSFYKGLNQNILIGFVGYGTVIFIYNFLYDKLNSYSFTRKYKILNSILSSSIGGFMAVIAVSPFSYLKTRQILYKGARKQSSFLLFVYMIKDIYYEKKTLLSFWKAFNPSLITSFYSAIQISLYQFLKEIFIDHDDTNFKLISLLGLISRCVASTVVFPFALIKSRMLNFQPDKLYDSLDKNKIFFTTNYKYKNVITDLRVIIMREGLLSVFRGLHFELIKVSINGALFFYSYEYLNKNYNSHYFKFSPKCKFL